MRPVGADLRAARHVPVFAPQGNFLSDQKVTKASLGVNLVRLAAKGSGIHRTCFSCTREMGPSGASKRKKTLSPHSYGTRALVLNTSWCHPHSAEHAPPFGLLLREGDRTRLRARSAGVFPRLLPQALPARVPFSGAVVSAVLIRPQHGDYSVKPSGERRASAAPASSDRPGPGRG